MSEILDLPIPQQADKVKNGEISAVALTERALSRMEAQSGLHAFLHVARDAALAAAAAVDRKRASGAPLGKLSGVPIAIKDALCTADAPTTCASKILTRRNADGTGGSGPESGWRPPYDATVVARLRAADAVLVGKTNMDEFAMGSSGENSAFGPAKNPVDPTRTPGGSSSGSAVAVAAGMALGSLGSDTGGSIRQPAAFCGVVGIKPSYGRVSRYGLVAFASSLDQIGPFAKSVQECAQVLSIICGFDPYDSTSADVPVQDFVSELDQPLKDIRIGVPREYFVPGLNAEVKKRFEESIKFYETLGCRVDEISLPHTEHAIAAYYLIATA